MTIDAHEYLTRFGYIESHAVEAFGFARHKAHTGPLVGNATLDADRVTAALKAFQRYHGLPETGALDAATEALMNTKRCGMPDVGETVLPDTFKAQGNRWEAKHLTYGFVETTADLGDARVRAITRNVFDTIEAACGLTFSEAHSGLPDIVIRFVTGEHGDGIAFDGTNGVLAHAYFPPPNGGHFAGDAHFDEAETWTNNGANYDYETVCLHEVLHSLGFAHSDIKESCVYPYYLGERRKLHPDDVAGLQSLYGAPVAPAPPAPAPPPAPPETPGAWPPFAIRRPGPASKSGGYAAGDSGPKRGAVLHSAVGFEGGMWSVLDDPNRQSSWHYSVMLDGRIFAHYPLTAHTWHANDSDNDGGVRGNLDLVGIEHEGGEPGNESAPLTEAQVQATVRLNRWCAEQSGLAKFGRYPFQQGVWTLAEHNEVGNAPTDCPSGRIPWARILAALAPPAPPAPPDDLPTHQQAAHALGFAYSAYFHRDRSLMHRFDRDVVRRVGEWLASEP